MKLKKPLFLSAMILVIIIAGFLSETSAQKLSIQKVKNSTAKILDWREAFPNFSGYRRKIEKAVIDEDGKLYFQTAKYMRTDDNSDAFEISLSRNSFTPKPQDENDWIKKIKIKEYDARKIFPTCGLDFRKYSLEVYLDDKTNITIGIFSGLKSDGIKLAEQINFERILAVMKKRKNIY